MKTISRFLFLSVIVCLLPLSQVAKLERAQSRLQGELERHKASSRAQEDLLDHRLQVDQLRERADRQTAELTSLQAAHGKLRWFHNAMTTDY